VKNQQIQQLSIPFIGLEGVGVGPQFATSQQLKVHANSHQKLLV
jgi:hypothetical protein